MARDQIVLCFNCGTKNRIRSGKSGLPKCGECGRILQAAASGNRIAVLLSTMRSEPQKLVGAGFVLVLLLLIGYAAVPNARGTR